MSGNADTIKDFLVSLGFDIDQAGANKFEAVLKGVTANVLKVGAVVEGAALSIVGFTTQIANGLDKIYWASQRTGASVQGIKALGYAASQTGASAESAMSSLEGLAGFIRSNPGAEGFLNRLGVQTRDASGKMRDTAAIFTGVGQKLNNMPYYRAKQYAQMLGIDENTLIAMRRGMNGFTADYQSMLQKTGFNADKAAVQSNKFMTSMRGLTSLFGIMRDKIGSNLAGGLAGSLDSLRRRILDNFPKIEETLTRVIKGVLIFAEAFSRTVYRLIQGAGAVIDWWKRLDNSSKNLLKVFGALLVAWRVLNSAFLKSPIGLITSLIIAIGLLWEDYQTWKEGGQSLIDWSKWEPAINYALKALQEMSDAFGDLWTSVKGLGKSLGTLWDKLEPLVKEFGELIGLDFSKFSAKSLFDSLTNSITNSIKVLSNLVDALKKVIDGDFSGAFDSLKIAGGIVLDSAKDTIGGGIYSSLNNKLNHYLPTWLGGSEDNVWSSNEPEQHAQSAKAPRGIRNNNPGNIDFRGQAGATLEKPGGRFARFETAYDGLKALSRQLMRYFEGKTTGKPLQTLNDIISTWAPGNENNTGAYIAQLSKMMGVAPDAILNLKDPQIMSSLMNGIIHHENGRNPYPSELVRMAAGGNTHTNSIQQQNTYNIYGNNAHEMGVEVERRQLNSNAKIMRTNQVRIS
ncbi:lytic transglycosylase [Citrobacter freundii]|uniref:lytic transglycosylase n=1 Tax=Citrobacter freundii TaxID=546 RepID=UPI0023AF5185|nr:lytic transglycosylase [Citrobacter freundii]